LGFIENKDTLSLRRLGRSEKAVCLHYFEIHVSLEKARSLSNKAAKSTRAFVGAIKGAVEHVDKGRVARDKESVASKTFAEDDTEANEGLPGARCARNENELTSACDRCSFYLLEHGSDASIDVFLGSSVRAHRRDIVITVERKSGVNDR
jgi:hypothetical protein